jgi:hypothetical protein
MRNIQLCRATSSVTRIGGNVWVCEARDLSRDRRVVERGSERVVWIVWEICLTFCEVDIHCRLREVLGGYCLGGDG